LKGAALLAALVCVPALAHHVELLPPLEFVPPPPGSYTLYRIMPAPEGRVLDVERVVTTGNFVDKPDLSKVDEIGFADLIPGSGHGPGGWADVAAIDVFAASVKRQ